MVERLRASGEPVSASAVSSRARPVIELVHAHGGAGALCVMRGDDVLVEEYVNCAPDDLFYLFSTSKPFVALLVHLLAQRGRLRLDDPVATHWPEYAREGKESITVRHVLTHRAGVPLARGSVVRDAWAMTNWERAVRDAERAVPRYPAGEVVAYHILTYGFILGELVRRVTGRPVESLLRSELLDPLGLRDIHLGLSDEDWSRRVPLRSTAPRDVPRRVTFNRRVTRQAVIPAAGVSANARDLARFYLMLLRGGELDGTRVLSPDAIAQATALSSDGEVDRLLRRPVRWAHGFQLGGPRGMRRPMGSSSEPTTFGHNGSGVCNAWADPVRGLVFVYLTDRLSPIPEAREHQCQVSDAVLAAFG